MNETHPRPPVRDAGIVSRSFAAVIDVVVVFVVMACGYLAAAFVVFTINVSAFHFPSVSWIFTTGGFFVASVLYLFVCWSVTERSVGQALLGLRLANSKGGRVRVPRVVLRAAFCVVFPVGLGWVALSPRRRSVQDVVLRTRVVYD